MSKGFWALLIAVLAVIGGAVFAVVVIRKRLIGNEIDFDDFDTAVDDEEFEHFFGESSAEQTQIAEKDEVKDGKEE